MVGNSHGLSQGELMSEPGSVRIEQQDGVARIEFSHPKANCLTTELLEFLVQSVREANALAKVQVISLESPGSTFCAGASFEEFNALSGVEEAESFFGRIASLFLTLRSSSKWVVVRADGKAVGGGVGLIAIADYALGGPETAVQLSEYALGIGPYVIGPVVARRIGSQAFASMALDCQWRDANWCSQRGLIDSLGENAQDVEARYQSLLTHLSERSPIATASLKRIAWEDTAHWEELLYARARTSAELLIASKAKAAKEDK